MSKTAVATKNATSSSSTMKSFTPVGDLLKKSWDLLTLSWKNLLLLSIILWAIVFVLILVLGGSVVGSLALSAGAGEMLSGLMGASVGLVVLLGLGILVASSAFGTSMMISIAEASQKPSIGSLISRGFKLFLPVFLTSLIMMFFIYGGLFLFVIPGIVVAIFTGFSIYEVIFTENRYLAAIKNSVKIVGQNFGELFIRVLVVFGLMIGLGILQGILQGLVGDNAGAQGLISLVMLVVQTVFGWFVMGYYYLVYKEARSLTDMNKGGSTVWLWVVAALGWLVGVFVLYAASTFIGQLMQRAGGLDSDTMESEMAPMLDEGTMDADQFIESYGQDMTDEEKAQLKEMMENADTMMQQDAENVEQEL